METIEPGNALPISSISTAKCEQCAFFEPKKNPSWGYCKERPPVPCLTKTGDWRAVFPSVNKNTWCGRFEQK